MNENILNVPDVLYHATYKPLLENIINEGLGNSLNKNWEDSKTGVVYLSNDPNVAESYAETSEFIPEAWLDQIVILKVSTLNLDKSNFFVDENNLNSDTLEYRGVIPSTNLSLF